MRSLHGCSPALSTWVRLQEIVWHRSGAAPNVDNNWGPWLDIHRQTASFPNHNSCHWGMPQAGLCLEPVGGVDALQLQLWWRRAAKGRVDPGELSSLNWDVVVWSCYSCYVFRGFLLVFNILFVFLVLLSHFLWYNYHWWHWWGCLWDMRMIENMQ
jgi:hypothetical protein